MNEIERAIEHIADNVRFLKTHPYVDDSLRAHELALEALKEKLARQDNAPLTCDWCRHHNSKSVASQINCSTCSRFKWVADRYEPKGEATT